MLLCSDTLPSRVLCVSLQPRLPRHHTLALTAFGARRTSPLSAWLLCSSAALSHSRFRHCYPANKCFVFSLLLVQRVESDETGEQSLHFYVYIVAASGPRRRHHVKRKETRISDKGTRGDSKGLGRRPPQWVARLITSPRYGSRALYAPRVFLARTSGHAPSSIPSACLQLNTHVSTPRIYGR